MNNIRHVLKERTQDLHREIEETELMRAVFQRDLSITAYAQIITVWSEWLTINEPAIGSMLGELTPTDYSSRLKQPLIALDTAALKLDTHTNNNRSTNNVTTIHFGNSHEALGALYVLEGASLGGNIIQKHLRRKLGDATPTHFYQSYQDNIPTMWQQFLEHLDSVVAHPEDVESVCVGAQSTFLSLIDTFNAGSIQQPPINNVSKVI